MVACSMSKQVKLAIFDAVFHITSGLVDFFIEHASDNTLPGVCLLAIISLRNLFNRTDHTRAVLIHRGHEKAHMLFVSLLFFDLGNHIVGTAPGTALGNMSKQAEFLEEGTIRFLAHTLIIQRQSE